MKIIIKVIAVLLLFWSCASQKKSTTGGLDSKATLLISYNQSSDSIQDLPEYTIEVYSNKQMYLTAIKNMDKTGKFMRTLSEKELSQILESFNQANFFKFQNEYNHASNNPVHRKLYFSNESKEKEVKFYDNAPEKLKELELLMQSFLDRVGWEKMTW